MSGGPQCTFPGPVPPKGTSGRTGGQRSLHETLRTRGHTPPLLYQLVILRAQPQAVIITMELHVSWAVQNLGRNRTWPRALKRVCL